MAVSGSLVRYRVFQGCRSIHGADRFPAHNLTSGGLVARASICLCSRTHESAEWMNIQFRAEFFNLFNTPFFEARNQTTDVTNPDFGRILQGSNPRNIQFGLRLVF